MGHPALPTDEVMRELAKLALEQAMQTISQQARDMAKKTPPEISGREALNAFADAMLSTSKKTWPGRSAA